MVYMRVFLFSLCSQRGWLHSLAIAISWLLVFTCDVYHGQLKLFYTGAVGRSLSTHVLSHDALSA